MLAPIGLALDAYLALRPLAPDAPLPRLGDALGGRETIITRHGVQHRVRLWTLAEWRALPLPDRPSGTVRRGDVIALIERIATRAG